MVLALADCQTTHIMVSDNILMQNLVTFFLQIEDCSAICQLKYLWIDSRLILSLGGLGVFGNPLSLSGPYHHVYGGRGLLLG